MKRRAFPLAFVTAGAIAGCNCGKQDTAAVFTREETAQLCVKLASCLPLAFDATWESLQFCTADRPEGFIPSPAGDPILITGVEPMMRDFYQCVLEAAGGCGAVGRCLSLTGSGGTCEPTGPTWGECEGDLWTGCSPDGYRIEADCSEWNRSCGSIYKAVDFHGCVDLCDRERCRGTTEIFCSDDAKARFDCSMVGKDCYLFAGEARCTYELCDPTTFEDRCEGTVAVMCLGDSDPDVWRWDCSRQSTFRRCEGGRCVMTETECDESHQDLCEGGAVQFCQDGLLRNVDCVAMGFSRCTAGRCE